MADRIEHAAHVVTQAGAVVAGSSFATFSMGWWNTNSAGIVAMAAVFGAICSLIGLSVSWYYSIKRVRGDLHD